MWLNDEDDGQFWAESWPLLEKGRLLNQGLRTKLAKNIRSLSWKRSSQA